MTPQEKEVTQVHAALFGVDGRGGIVNDIREIREELKDLSAFKGKLVGMCLGISVVVGILAKLIHL